MSQAFELPDFYLPWPARLNPHVDGARAHSTMWAYKVGILNPPPEDRTPELWSEEKLASMDIGLFCAYSHPDATPEDLELITDWIVWAFYFDDFFLIYKRNNDGAGLRAQLERLASCMTVDLDAPSPEATNPMERGLLDLWHRTVPRHTIEWRRRFRASTMDMLNVVDWELRNIKAGRVANPIEFVQWRRPAGGAAWTLYFVEHVNIVEVPERVWNKRPLRVLRDTFTDGVHYRNDLFSYEREMTEEGELSNFVLVLERFFDIEPQAAANMTNDVLSSRLYQFEHTAATEVPIMMEEDLLLPAERTAVVLFIKGLQDWQSGCHEWHLRSSRYTKPTRRRLPAPTGLGTAAARMFSASPEANGLKRLRAYTNVPLQQVGPLPRPVAYMPFPSRINPHYEVARRRSAVWTREMGMYEPAPEPLGVRVWNESLLEQFDFAQLAARGFPALPEAALEFVTKWTIWGTYFDDYVWWIYERDRDLAGAKLLPIRLELFMPLDGGPTPQPINPVERGMADLWPQFLAQMSPEHCRRCRELHLAMLGAWIWELENDLQNRVPDPIDYMETRRYSIAAEIYLWWAGLALQELVSPKLFTMHPLVELKNITADHTGLVNDIFSYQAEVQYEGSINNSVVIAESFFQISREQAVQVISDLLNRRVEQFEHIVASELPIIADQFALDDAEREALAEYVETLMNWMVGMHDWHAATRRYESDYLPGRYALSTALDPVTPGAGPTGLGMHASTLAARVSSINVAPASRKTPPSDGSDRGGSTVHPMPGSTRSDSPLPLAPTPSGGDSDQAAVSSAVPGAAEVVELIAEVSVQRSLMPLPPLASSPGDEAQTKQDRAGMHPSVEEPPVPKIPTGWLNRPGADAAKLALHTKATSPDDERLLREPLGVPQATNDVTRSLASNIRRRSRRPTVAVFGGGIAGLAAAHELIERGFAVDVYEKRHWGGKARSTEVAGSARDGRRPLPGEHGLRAEFGFYQNVPDTMRRIPFGANPHGVFDNLVEMPQFSALRQHKRDVIVPFGPSDPLVRTPRQLVDLLVAFLVEQQIEPDAAAYFAKRMTVFCSSCDARRDNEWESISWKDFIGVGRFSADYATLLGEASQFLQSTKPENTSAKFHGWFLELVIHSLLGFGSNGPTGRMLNQPTSIAWIDPWVRWLEHLGVRMNLHHELLRLAVKGGKIVGAEMQTPDGNKSILADWYICALPIERARALWTPEILAADPSLARMNRIHTAAQNGIQFYLRDRVHITAGAALCVDSPWKMNFAHQAQFWSGDFASTFGDGHARDCLSAIVSDWDRPGIVYGKVVADCTPEQIAREAWEQIKTHVNKVSRRPKLTDDMVLGWWLDDGIVSKNGRLMSEELLPSALVKTERYRPNGVTKIPNLILAGDYLDGAWQIGTMEAANYYGRLAANAVLDAARSAETPANAIGPYRPPHWQLLKQADAQRYANGESNLFDVEGPLPPEVAKLLEQGAP